VRDSQDRMDELDPYLVQPIGVVRSRLRAPADAPNQAFEGAPDPLLEIDPAFADALHRVWGALTRFGA
jgi:tRNA (Thr-GGU) A37 N-methylase